MTESTKMLSIATTLILLAIIVGTTIAIISFESRQQQQLNERIGSTDLSFALDDYNGEQISGSAIYAMISRGVHVYDDINIPLVSSDLQGDDALSRTEARDIAGIERTLWYTVEMHEHNNGVQALVVFTP